MECCGNESCDAGPGVPGVVPLSSKALRDVAAMLDVMDDLLRYLIPFTPNVSDEVKAPALELFSGDDMQQNLRRWADELDGSDGVAQLRAENIGLREALTDCRSELARLESDEALRG